MAVRILPAPEIADGDEDEEEYIPNPRLKKNFDSAIRIVSENLADFGITDETIYYEWGPIGGKKDLSANAMYLPYSQFPGNSKTVDRLIKKSNPPGNMLKWWKALTSEVTSKYEIPGPIVVLDYKYKIPRDFTDELASKRIAWTLLHEYGHAVEEYFEIARPETFKKLNSHYEELEEYGEYDDNVLDPWMDDYEKDPKSIRLASELWCEDFAATTLKIGFLDNDFLPIDPEFVYSIINEYVEDVFGHQFSDF